MEVLKPPKTRSLFSEAEIVKYHISDIVELNTENKIYITYKERLGRY
jgi:hypothetical protein